MSLLKKEDEKAQEFDLGGISDLVFITFADMKKLVRLNTVLDGDLLKGDVKGDTVVDIDVQEGKVVGTSKRETDWVCTVTSVFCV